MNHEPLFLYLDVPTPRGASSTISPLLYSWQSRKARTSQSCHHASPGTIVPLVFDASLADDCERAKDTILAYCNQHSLNLRTLLVPPITPSPNSRISGGTSPIRSRQSSSSGTLTPALVSQGAIWKPSQRGRLPPLPGPLIHTTQASMHDAMSRCIFQPLGMIQALASMLHESRSQVIFVSGCDETSFRCEYIPLLVSKASRWKLVVDGWCLQPIKVWMRFAMPHGLGLRVLYRQNLALWVSWCLM